MRLVITADTGEEIEVIEQIDLYDLTKPIAISSLIGEIQAAIQCALKQGYK